MDVKRMKYSELFQLTDNVSAGEGERKPLFTCAATLYRLNPETGGHEVVVCDYNKDGIDRVKLRFPAGQSNVGEKIYDTLRRIMRTLVKYETRKTYRLVHWASFSDNKTGEVDKVVTMFARKGHYHTEDDCVEKANRTKHLEYSNFRWEPLNEELIRRLDRKHRESGKRLIHIVERDDAN